MKNPNYPAFSQYQDIGISKIQYTYIEILKASVEPGKVYTEQEIDALLKNASFIAKKAFEKPVKKEESVIFGTQYQ